MLTVIFVAVGGVSPYMASPMHSPAHPGGGGRRSTPNMSPGPNQGGGGIGRGDSRIRRDNTLIGKSVRITQGPMKGKIIVSLRKEKCKGSFSYFKDITVL